MTFAAESPEGQGDVCRRVYHDLERHGPSLLLTIERRQGLLPGYAQAALDALASRGRAELLPPTNGEKIGRWVAKERKR